MNATCNGRFRPRACRRLKLFRHHCLPLPLPLPLPLSGAARCCRGVSLYIRRRGGGGALPVRSGPSRTAPLACHCQCQLRSALVASLPNPLLPSHWYSQSVGVGVGLHACMHAPGRRRRRRDGVGGQGRGHPRHGHLLPAQLRAPGTIARFAFPLRPFPWIGRRRHHHRTAPHALRGSPAPARPLLVFTVAAGFSLPLRLLVPVGVSGHPPFFAPGGSRAGSYQNIVFN